MPDVGCFRNRDCRGRRRSECAGEPVHSAEAPSRKAGHSWSGRQPRPASRPGRAPAPVAPSRCWLEWERNAGQLWQQFSYVLRCLFVRSRTCALIREELARPTCAVFRQDVVQPPFPHVDSKLILVNQTATKARPGITVLNDTDKSPDYLIPHAGGNIGRLGRIDIAKQDQCPQDNFPVVPGQRENPVPVQLALGSIDDMSNVSPVESLAPGHEKLGGDELLGS